MTPYRVRAVHCDHRATDDQVYGALKRATAPLTEAWTKLEGAERITVKFNQAYRPDRLIYLEGQLQELVAASVARATLRLLRERTRADLYCCELSTAAQGDEGLSTADTITLMEVLREFDVIFVDGNTPPHRVCTVPGGGLMFDQYVLPEVVADTDAFVSVQKLKSHKFMGVTLCLKNLFGLTPMEPYGRSRRYFHHLVRLPYVLVDLGEIIQPTLSIVDALVGQSGSEWNGDSRICDSLIAGDHVVATDACATELMGLDPRADWPQQPFVRDRNSLLIAHEAGFGTADTAEIDFVSEVEAPLASFRTLETDPYETVLSWRRTTCQQALYYRNNRERFWNEFQGEYILLQDGDVRWHGSASEFRGSRRELAGGAIESAMWFKLVDPDEAEGEHFEVYERVLEGLTPDLRT